MSQKKVSITHTWLITQTKRTTHIHTQSNDSDSRELPLNCVLHKGSGHEACRQTLPTPSAASWQPGNGMHLCAKGRKTLPLVNGKDNLEHMHARTHTHTHTHTQRQTQTKSKAKSDRQRLALSNTFCPTGDESKCFEPSQPQRIITKTNVCPRYSAHKSRKSQNSTGRWVTAL